MTYGIGLCGAHRTGKTTLAKAWARHSSLEMVETTTSAIFTQHGINPAQPMDFATRLWIQDKILTAAEEIWRAHATNFITDRTPLDMLAYTLADVRGDSAVDDQQLSHYMTRCFQATNTFFSYLMVVQPGIPLVAAHGKAALHNGYIEHLNTLIIGLCGDEDQLTAFTVMPRATLDLNERCKLLTKKCPLPLT